MRDLLSSSFDWWKMSKHYLCIHIKSYETDSTLYIWIHVNNFCCNSVSLVQENLSFNVLCSQIFMRSDR